MCSPLRRALLNDVAQTIRELSVRAVVWGIGMREG